MSGAGALSLALTGIGVFITVCGVLLAAVAVGDLIVRRVTGAHRP